MLVTILTPTFNRGYTLKRLYESLIIQDDMDFEWLIVNDGSNDNTEELISSFIMENKISIKYIYQENGGKHRALNNGLLNIDSKYTAIVDSDDYLLPDTISTIKEYDKKYKNEKKLCGFSFLKIFDNKDVIGVAYKESEFISNYIDCRVNQETFGDKFEVFYTNVLKKFPFPEFPNEKFMSEDVVWIEIAKKYNTVYINKKLYVAEYLEDGLTHSDKKSKFNSPYGSMLRGKQLMSGGLSIKNKIKGAIIYNCYKMEVNKIPEMLKIKGLINKLLIIVTIAPGFIYNIKWKKEI